MLIRLFDLILSFLLILFFLPFFAVIAIAILFDSKGGIFYFQKRVGLKGKEFNLIKFRTMYAGSEKKGLLTVGAKDPRITRTGNVLRKYKFDELPQLFNVLGGTMSLVGPRPEVGKYVDFYTEEQKKVLDIKPGITDYASIIYFNENEILSRSADPEQTYIKEIMPAKIRLNMTYIENKNIKTYLSVLFKTGAKIIRNIGKN
jgi:lipopolysaccharide/colanic/teichoic acid biosynthesis glycosyltransferase